MKEQDEQFKSEHFSEWLKLRPIVFEKLSNSQSMFCICGRLASGLHESHCRKFNNSAVGG